MKKLIKPIKNLKMVTAYTASENASNFQCNVVAGCS
ncbi:hypothetical protein PAECIP111894_03739 [Paenibacillus pseudetheri]|uniref:Lantibiotic n=1 Tax=Paenibacillus pseudetheri TaxID=2897682 RepID=A0ABM9BHI9_9BACL|nr:hypothetical protein PAECIP111894_03739 [Paenibacillus pseudetheri]